MIQAIVLFGRRFSSTSIPFAPTVIWSPASISIARNSNRIAIPIPFPAVTASGAWGCFSAFRDESDRQEPHDGKSANDGTVQHSFSSHVPPPISGGGFFFPICGILVTGFEISASPNGDT
jgi:hypothetical protein